MVGPGRVAVLTVVLGSCAGQAHRGDQQEAPRVAVDGGAAMDAPVAVVSAATVDARESPTGAEVAWQIGRLYEEHEWEIEPAIEWLVHHPEESREPLRAIVEELRFGTGTRHAMLVLGRIGDVRDVPLLASALHRARNEMMQWGAADALGAHNSEEAVVALIAALSDPERKVIDAAVIALGERRDEAARPGLEALLDHPYEGTRFRVVRALGKIGAAGSDAALRKRAKVETVEDVKKALAALGY